MECPICLEKLTNKFLIKTPCKHVFCLSCFSQLSSVTCPLCRSNFERNLPDEFLKIIKKNSINNPTSYSNSSTPNIHNLNDFPPLG